ncbi:hypothetical protein [Actinoplanes nipponensis]|uniref:hypothetical protein n=1 Tax=Actinoplanes nipponensis TaxID=135950 RepID=UPI0019412839|nr:hypothetical protein [Actinoplanes nipponensis]
MIRRTFALVLVGVVASAGLVASGAHHGASAGTTGRPAGLDVLFVGNSLIGTRAATGEDTPDVVRRLARDGGREVRATKVIRYGQTLRRTWDGGAARHALDGSTRYDYIVLQEYSTLIVTDPARVTATLLDTYAPALARSLKPGGRVVLFENWALAGPAPSAARARTVAVIRAGYARLAAALPAPTVIAPVGDAFEAVVTRDGPGAVLAPDGKHPTGRGIYLEAVTLHGLFFGESPRDLPDLYLPPATAGRLRTVAAAALGY